MRQLPYRTTQWKVSLPTVIAGRVEQRLSNITGTGPAYGARSKLLSFLLEGWLDLTMEQATDVLKKAEQVPAQPEAVSEVE